MKKTQICRMLGLLAFASFMLFGASCTYRVAGYTVRPSGSFVRTAPCASSGIVYGNQRCATPWVNTQRGYRNGYGRTSNGRYDHLVPAGRDPSGNRIWAGVSPSGHSYKTSLGHVRSLPLHQQQGYPHGNLEYYYYQDPSGQQRTNGFFNQDPVYQQQPYW